MMFPRSFAKILGPLLLSAFFLPIILAQAAADGPWTTADLDSLWRTWVEDPGLEIRISGVIHIDPTDGTGITCPDGAWEKPSDAEGPWWPGLVFGDPWSLEIEAEAPRFEDWLATEPTSIVGAPPETILLPKGTVVPPADEPPVSCGFADSAGAE